MAHGRIALPSFAVVQYDHDQNPCLVYPDFRTFIYYIYIYMLVRYVPVYSSDTIIMYAALATATATGNGSQWP